MFHILPTRSNLIWQLGLTGAALGWMIFIFYASSLSNEVASKPLESGTVSWLGDFRSYVAHAVLFGVLAGLILASLWSWKFGYQFRWTVLAVAAAWSEKVQSKARVMKTLYGHRIGKQAKLPPSCSGVAFNAARDKVLLTRRADNGRWCLPGGAMDPGESAVECCAREVLEETGLMVNVGRLVGLYSDPHIVYEYQDRNRVQGLTLTFEVEPIGGELSNTIESIEVGYFSLEQLKTMDVMEAELLKVFDAFADQEAAFVR